MPPEESGTAPLPDIKDIAGPDALLDVWELVALWAGGIVTLVLLGVALRFLVRAAARDRAMALSPVEEARRRLGDLEARADSMAPNAFSVAVSDTLKEYLSQRYGDPVRYETSEEFLQRLARAEANALPVTTREAVARFLAVADEIKYGRPPDAEARKRPLLDQAREAIASSVSASAGAPAPSEKQVPPKRQAL